MKTIISFATAWGSHKGGINAFNAELLPALAIAYPYEVRVVCVVLFAEIADRENAKNEFNIDLVSLARPEVSAMGEDLLPTAWNELGKLEPELQIDADTVWLGHDRITGALANKAKETYGGRSALIHHMSYDHYENYAENSATANAKVQEQKSLFKSADIRLAVGMLLDAALQDMLDCKNVYALTPGLAEIEPRDYKPNTFKVFLSGRLNADSQKIKQAYLGLAGFANAVRRCDEDKNYPDCLRSENEPQLRLRGLNFEDIQTTPQSTVEQSCREFVQEHAGRPLSLSLLPFTHNRQDLFEELRSTSATLMPSWHEGFGLVAWEAIAAGVPLVLSKKSGVYRLLKDRTLENYVISINPEGNTNEPYFSDADKQAVSDALIQIAKDNDNWREKAARLREQLQDCSWQQCATQLISAFGWSLTEIGNTVISPDIVSIVEAPQPLTPNSNNELLELPQPRWHNQAKLSPSQLLRAEETLVPFDSARQPFLDEQIQWAEQETAPLSVRLLIGQGGCGKTRLALQMCQELKTRGWLAGLLPSQSSSMPELARKLQQHSIQGQPILIVVDYAETRQAAVLDLLSSLQKSTGATSPIRVLLLARSGGEWWLQLPNQKAGCESLLLGAATSGPYTLPLLHIGHDQRDVAYKTALKVYAQVLNRSEPPHKPNLSGAQFAHPLPMQMAALLALHGQAFETSNSLSRAIVAHEMRYWTKATESIAGLTIEAPQLFMTLATLVGQVASVKDFEILWAACEMPKNTLKPLWQALHALYPDTQGMQGLRPDLLGEALVTQTLLSIDGEAALNAVFRQNNREWSHHALTVLARILRTRDDVSAVVAKAISPFFSQLASALCDVLVATDCPPLSALAIQVFEAATPQMRQQTIGVLNTRLKEDILPLNDLALSIRLHQVLFAEKKYSKNKTLAHSIDFSTACFHLALAYKNVGQITEAIKFSRLDLDISKDLAKKQPELYNAGWATSLSNHANRLSENGDHLLALELSQQALAIRKDLAQVQPELYTADWVTSLSNHASYLSDNGDHQRALELSQQALDIRKKLAKKQPERFTAGWATSLSNHANYLSVKGNHQQALELSQQALAIRKDLAQKQPEHYTADRAISLNNHAIFLSDNGNHQQALKLSQQALAIHKDLAQKQPDRYFAEWAMSLSNLASHLSDNGDHQQALEFSKQALAICKDLMQKQPERYTAAWGMSLANHSIYFANDGGMSQACMFGQQALELYSNLAIKIPAKHQALYTQVALLFALWQWLNGENPEAQQLVVPEVQTNVCSTRDQAWLQFVLACLKVLHACEIKKDDLLILLEQSREKWHALDDVQKRSHEDWVIVISIVTSEQGLKPLQDNWNDLLRKCHIRCKGNIPVWMTLCVEKLGLQWPEVNPTQGNRAYSSN